MGKGMNNMIQIGLTGWGDHPDLAGPNSTAKDKLIDYTSYFPVVELDSTFYAIQPERNIQKWIQETPSNFQFVVKAYQGITGHMRGEMPFASKEEMYGAFIQSILPLQVSGKLAMILVQFPPWFDCIKAHVDEIRFICEQLKAFPIAIEFRHQSWYSLPFKDKTIAFLRELNIIHTVCDEPQAGEGSIPLVPIATRNDQVLFRLHGRNVYGWRNTFGDDQTWRTVRYLYNYNEEELKEIEQTISQLIAQTKKVIVIFNNNSGKHAAQNALQIGRQMGIEYDNLASQQLTFFEKEL